MEVPSISSGLPLLLAETPLCFLETLFAGSSLSLVVAVVV
jgi:hypothetical protein